MTPKPLTVSDLMRAADEIRAIAHSGSREPGASERPISLDVYTDARAFAQRLLDALDEDAAAEIAEVR